MRHVPDTAFHFVESSFNVPCKHLNLFLLLLNQVWSEDAYAINDTCNQVPRFNQYVTKIEGNLAVQCRQALDFVIPIYMFQTFCDGNHPGCFQCGAGRWMEMAKQTKNAIFIHAKHDNVDCD